MYKNPNCKRPLFFLMFMVKIILKIEENVLVSGLLYK